MKKQQQCLGSLALLLLLAACGGEPKSYWEYARERDDGGLRLEKEPMLESEIAQLEEWRKTGREVHIEHQLGPKLLRGKLMGDGREQVIVLFDTGSDQEVKVQRNWGIVRIDSAGYHVGALGETAEFADKIKARFK